MVVGILILTGSNRPTPAIPVAAPTGDERPLVVPILRFLYASSLRRFVVAETLESLGGTLKAFTGTNPGGEEAREFLAKHSVGRS